MFGIEKQVDISGCRQVIGGCEHSARMTLAERGGRAVMRVLSKDARVVAVSAVPAGGDVDVSGKVVCTAVCEIAGGEIVCLEYLGGFSFSHKVSGVRAGSSCDVSADIRGVRVVRASGCEVVLEVDFGVYENFAVQGGEVAVVSAEGCYCEVDNVVSTVSVLKVHNFTALAEMEVDSGIALVLARYFCAEVENISAREGSCVVSGNVHGFVSFLDGAGGVKNQACSFPFREEFSCEGADDFGAFARALEHSVVCEVNEVRGVSVVTCEVEVEISLWGFSAVKFERGRDFFSDKVQILAENAEFVSSDFCGCEQAFGKFSDVVAFPYELPSDVCIGSARVAGVSRRGESCVFDCELAVTVCGNDLKFSEFAVKAEIAFPASGDGKTTVCDVGVCEIDCRIAGSKVEIFGKLCGNLLVCCERRETVVSALSCGDEKPDGGGGFVLYRAENGETLLDVCEAVGVMPDLLKTQNPNVEFPVVGERKVVVWK